VTDAVATQLTTRPIGLTVYACEPDEALTFEELSPRFGVTPTITSAAVSPSNVLAGPANRCISVGHKAELSAPMLRDLHDTGVEYVSTRSIGVNHIDLDAATQLGITVENVTYAPDGVADYTVMLMLMAIRNAKEIVHCTMSHDFRLRSERGRELRDMTVGVVGAGNIGTAVIERLRGFGCRVVACNDENGATGVAAERLPLDELLAASDIVTLHVPLNADTHHLIGRAELAAMKPDAYLVNTGRGALVDTDALVVALEEGRLSGVAVDVLEGEEGLFYFDCTNRRVDHQLLARLQRLPNAIVTPHTAYYTQRALSDTVEQTLSQCIEFERSHG
jgi:D-specific alpha-keto acid dehydrogenase